MTKPITWPTLHDRNCARQRENKIDGLDRAHRKSQLVDFSLASPLDLFDQPAIEFFSKLLGN
jgi:hypothetical protein